MSSNPLLHTDPNDYGFIETFNNTVASLPAIPTEDHVLTGGATLWAQSADQANEPYKVITAGECIAGSLSPATAVSSMLHKSDVQNWYFELGNLASGEHVRLYVKKTNLNVARDDATFNGLTVYFKNLGDATLQSRLGATIAGSLDATDQTAYAEHTDQLAATEARFGVLVSWDGSTLSVTAGGVTNTLTLTTANAAIFTTYQYVGIHFNSNSGADAGTAKIYEVRAW